MKIEINNLTASQIDKNFLRKVAEKVLEGPSFAKASEGKKKELDLSIALVGLKRIKELNKRYRKKNKTTDILSFLYNGLGEIIICPQQVKKNAKRFGEVFKKELTRVLIHGILHLLGYDHEKTEKEARLMEKRQNYYLSKIK